MTWFKVDDRLHSHPKVGKVLDSRPSALGLWVVAGSWCSANLTDGAVPRGQVLRMGFAVADAEALAVAGLWHDTPDGWHFHDWPEYQPTRAQVLAGRAETAKRVSKYRRSNSVTHDVTPPVTNAVCTPAPDPDPDPDPDPGSRSRTRIQRKTEITEGVAADRPRKRNGKAPDTAEAWAAYSEAYAIRYGIAPVRNAKVNSQLAQFCRRVPLEEAPFIAAAYLRSQNARYLAAGHPVGCLLQDAEKLRTEAATGRSVTASAARRMDHTADRADEYEEMFARLRRRDEMRAKGLDPDAKRN